MALSHSVSDLPEARLNPSSRLQVTSMKNPSPILVLVVLLAACAHQEAAPEGVDRVDASEPDDAAWTQELLEERGETDEELRTSKTSPMAATQYLKSEPADEVHLTREGRTFGLTYSPDPAAEIAVRRGQSWTWEDLGEPDVSCEIDEEPVPSESTLDGPATFDIAGLTLGFYPGEDRVTFIVYDPERPEKTSFEHLLYFPPDRSYEVRATLVPIPEPDAVEMLTSQGLTKTFYRYARLRFEIEGEEQELVAYKSALSGDGSDLLFIPFRDATSGKETYGGGRFMDVEEPEGEQLTLDFNRAYNPLCNYSPGFNCPIPPRENHLDVAIRAGEKTYPH
jgi:hypothetical protein